jgi:hypothetical protein
MDWERFMVMCGLMLGHVDNENLIQIYWLFILGNFSQYLKQFYDIFEYFKAESWWRH